MVTFYSMVRLGYDGSLFNREYGLFQIHSIGLENKMREKIVNILLVEDNEDDIIMTLEAFKDVEAGKIVEVLRDGEEVMTYLRREAPYEEAKAPHLILMDINMPKKDGFEVLKEIKSTPTLQYIPVIMLTTSTREQDIIKAYNYGANSYISKPVGFSGLVQVAKQLATYWTVVSCVPRY